MSKVWCTEAICGSSYTEAFRLAGSTDRLSTPDFYLLLLEPAKMTEEASKVSALREQLAHTRTTAAQTTQIQQ